MFIEEVYLKDIFSHRETRVRFGRGLNVIIGPNGAGKSAIIDSIVYALLVYGRGSEEIMRTSKKNMIRAGASQGEIRVLFSYGGHRYELQRIVSPRGESEDVLRQVSPRQAVVAVRGSVPREVYKILGVSDPKMLTSTIISRQDHLNEILLERPSERRERILRLVGLDKLEEARERLREVSREVETELNRVMLEIGRKRQLEREVERLDQELRSKREEYERLRPEYEKTRREVEELEKRRERVQRLLQEAHILLQYSDLVKRYEEKKSSLEDLRERLRRYSDIDIEGLKRLREQILSLVNSLGAYTRERSERHREIEKIDSELGSLLEKLSGLLERGVYEKIERLYRERVYRDAVEVLREHIGLLEKRSASLEAEKRVYSSFIENFRETDRCPICGTPLTREKVSELIDLHEKRLESIEREVSILRDLVERLRRYRERLEALVESIERGLGRVRELEERVSETGRELEKTIEICREAVERVLGTGPGSPEKCIEAIDSIVRDYEVLRDRAGVLEREVGELRGSIERIGGQVSLFKKDLEEFLVGEGLSGYREGDVSSVVSLLRSVYEDISRRYTSARELYEKVSRRVGVLEGEILSLTNELEKKRAELEKLRDLERERARLEKIKTVLEKLSDLFKKDGYIASRMTSMVRSSLEKEVNRVLREIGRGFSIKIGEDFDITVVYGTGLERPLENLSGGEKTMLSIALRLALARVLTGRIPRFMILDEPTQNLDRDMRTAIFEVIKRIAGGMDQVIVVSHDEELIERADHLIRVVNEGGVSRVYTE